MAMTDRTSLMPVPAVTTKRGLNIKVTVNEEATALADPILMDMKNYGDLDPEKTKAGMNKEMKAMREFDVYEEVDTTTVSQEIIDSAIDTRFHRKDQLQPLCACAYRP